MQKVLGVVPYLHDYQILMIRLAVDPGLRQCGCALFADAKLIAADLVASGSKHNRASAWLPMAEAARTWVAIVGVHVDRLVVELPQVYHAKIETDQNDLIHLAAVVGALCSEFKDADIEVVLPAEWKGQVPKAIMHARMMKRLDTDERAALPTLPKSKLHNVLDAVSIGLVDLKRMN